MISKALDFLAGCSLTRLSATLLVGFALGGVAAWQVQNWRCAAHDQQRAEAQAELRRNSERASTMAAAEHEKDKANDQERIRTIRVTVDKIVDRPVYRRECLDADGLRALADALGHPAAATQPGATLPRPAAAH